MASIERVWERLIELERLVEGISRVPASSGTIRPGIMSLYAGDPDHPPPGWLLSAGQAVSRTKYADLYAAIGTQFGVGDGSTTFNLPDPQNRFIIGSGDTYSRGEEGGTTSHVHDIDGHAHLGTMSGETDDYQGNGILLDDNADGVQHMAVEDSNWDGFLHRHTITDQSLTIDLSDSQQTKSQDHLPPYLGMPWVIKT